MNSLKFTEEEIAQMNLTLNKVLDNMREIWQVSQLQSVDIDFSSAFRTCWWVTIGDDIISLETEEDEIILEKQERKFNKYKLARVKINDSNADIIYQFLIKYDEIKQSLEQEVQRATAEKAKIMTMLKEIDRKYDKEATIEVELPPSQNAASIRVTEENGKTIGEIKMGSGTIRIITKGNIILDRSTDSEKVKRM